MLSQRKRSKRWASILATAVTADQAGELQIVSFPVLKYPSCNAVALGHNHVAVTCLMAEQGLFHVMVEMLLYPPTSQFAAVSLGKLANSKGQAGWEAQVHF